MAIAFSVHGDPVPQPRPRVTTRGGHGHAYTPSTHKVHGYRAAVAAAARAAGAVTHGEPVEMVIDFVFARPKSHLRKGGLAHDAPRIPRADLDNMAKAVMDALNGVAFDDDSQVRRLVVEKTFGTDARTTVRIT